MSAARDGTAVLRDVRAVLFDLDGTFADTAPDMARALNAVRHARQLPPVPLSQLRPHVSNGARGMLQAGFNLKPGDGDFPALRDAFYAEYAANLCIESCWFDGISTLIDELEKREIIWGIVTNKATRFAEPLVRALGLNGRAATLVCGDTTPHAKPHPEPLLEAARRLRVDATSCAYVGDDLRDVQAGKAADMTTIAVAWGYLGLGESIDAWGADHVVQTPHQLLQLLAMA